MGKKTAKTKKSHSASASIDEISKISHTNKLLKPRSPEKMKMTTRQTIATRKLNNLIISPNKSITIEKKKNKEDAKMPKKPPTAFFYFLEHFRKDYQAQNPDVKSMRHVGKACGDKWKTMTYEEKVQYYDIATEKRAEFEEAMVRYKKRQESGEDQESDGDSEFDE